MLNGISYMNMDFPSGKALSTRYREPFFFFFAPCFFYEKKKKLIGLGYPELVWGLAI